MSTVWATGRSIPLVMYALRAWTFSTPSRQQQQRQHRPNLIAPCATLLLFRSILRKQLPGMPLCKESNSRQPKLWCLHSHRLGSFGDFAQAYSLQRRQWQLSQRPIHGWTPIFAVSATDPTDPKVENEVFIAGDQSVRIKSTHTQNFRRRNTSPDNSINNWISADSNDTANKNSDKHQRRQCRCSSSQPGQQQFLQEVDWCQEKLSECSPPYSYPRGPRKVAFTLVSVSTT